jgi:hypothetical protein
LTRYLPIAQTWCCVLTTIMPFEIAGVAISTSPKSFFPRTSNSAPASGLFTAELRPVLREPGNRKGSRK